MLAKTARVRRIIFGVSAATSVIYKFGHGWHRNIAAMRNAIRSLTRWGGIGQNLLATSYGGVA